MNDEMKKIIEEEVAKKYDVLRKSLYECYLKCPKCGNFINLLGSTTNEKIGGE